MADKRVLTPQELNRAETTIRKDFEKKIAKFMREIDGTDYGDADLSEWDFVYEFVEWCSFQGPEE